MFKLSDSIIIITNLFPFSDDIYDNFLCDFVLFIIKLSVIFYWAPLYKITKKI